MIMKVFPDTIICFSRALGLADGLLQGKMYATPQRSALSQGNEAGVGLDSETAETGCLHLLQGHCLQPPGSLAGS